MMLNKLWDIKRWKVGKEGFLANASQLHLHPVTSLQPPTIFNETVAQRGEYRVVGSPELVLWPGYFMKKPCLTARSSLFSGVS